MRFKLTLHNPQHKQLLGWNYNYLVMGWLYRTLEAADPDYARFLHQEGYRAEGNEKRFKLLTFSPFYFRNMKNQYAVIQSKGLEIYADTLFIDLSFYVPQAAESFILGVFQNQTMHIYNERFSAKFLIKQIETLAEPIFEESMIYRANAPMLIEKRTENKKYGDYISPTDVDFAKLFTINLADKYLNATGQQIDYQTIRFELVSKSEEIKSKKIEIKEKSNEATELRGFYNFDFRLIAPPDVQRCGYFSGFGRYNAEGLGMVEVNKIN